MDCKIDIKKDGKFFTAMLPFNPRKEFGIPKGTIFTECVINDFKFKIKLMPRGNEEYCIFFNKKLLADIGIHGDEALGLQLSIEPVMKEPPGSTAPEMLDNEALSVIRGRASIRNFGDKKITAVQINTILNAGFCTPSAKNNRPFHFVVSESRDKLLRLSESNSNVKLLTTAAACIIVCGDKVLQGIPELLIEDCSAATQNMLLAIHSIGLGGVWCGVTQSSELYKNIVAEFELPNRIRPISLIALGYPNEEKTQPIRFESCKVHMETW